eukprot:INCI11749.1.p1 GENE.INCI11749.1~~INCI11749.1.p1  ORF type:complete len:249 (+),score=19.31 INCI11749.1:29-775(+)
MFFLPFLSDNNCILLSESASTRWLSLHNMNVDAEDQNQRMLIFVVSLDSKTVPLNLPVSATVQTLRDQFDPILQHSGRACKCTLYFQGVKLLDSRARLSIFGVIDGSVLVANITSINLRTSPYAPIEARHRYWRCIRDDVRVRSHGSLKGQVMRRLCLGDTICESALVRNGTRVWLKLKEQKLGREQWVQLWSCKSLKLNFQPVQPPGTSEHELLQAAMNTFPAVEDVAESEASTEGHSEFLHFAQTS